MLTSERKKRILFYHVSFPAGGGERVTLDIAHFLQNEPYEIYIATCNKRGETDDVQVIALPNNDEHSKENANAIIEQINSLSIDIFVVVGFLWKQLPDVRKKSPCKFVFALHSIPFYEAPLYKELLARKVNRSFLKRLKWRFMGYHKRLKMYKKIIIKQYKEVYDLTDAYIVLCDGYKKTLEKKLRLSEKNKIKVIPNSEHTVKDVCRDKKKQILFVGRMTYEDKRVDRLLDIWKMIYKKLPDWELILVGSGPDESALQEQAKRAKLKRITFSGWSYNPAEFYKDASVSCLTSTFEGWPLCLTEAQVNGVIPIAFDCSDGVREILSPSGENGILIPPFHKKRYANELYKLLTNPEKLATMRENVIRKSRQYSVEMVGKKWLRLFNKLTEMEK